VKHVVQFSTGAGSAEVAFRVLDANYPRDTVLITADTRVEGHPEWNSPYDSCAIHVRTAAERDARADAFLAGLSKERDH
jgi:hypothetical protein